MAIADNFTLKLGETTFKGRRLTIREIRENWKLLMEGGLDIEKSLELVRSHVKLDDGTAFNPEDLSQGQLRDLIAEMTLPKEGRGISDFIGLLC